MLNATDATSGAGIAYPSGAPVFSEVRVQFYVYVLQIVVCPFVLFLLAIVLSVLLRYTDSDYPFGIFKLFFSSSLPPIVCGKAYVLLMLFVFVCIQWSPTHTVLCFCFVFLRLMYPMLPVSLDCPFVIAPSVFSNVYLQYKYLFKEITLQ